MDKLYVSTFSINTFVDDLYTDLDLVSKRLNLDLRKVNLKVFPFLSEDYSSRITKNYDIFINATYLSSLPAFAKRNLYLCYFPTPFDVDFKLVHKLLLIFFRLPAIWLYKLADKLTKGFKEVEVLQGVYDVKRFMLRRGSFTSGKAAILYNFNQSIYSKVKNYNQKKIVKSKNKNEIRVGFKNPASLGVNEIECKVELYVFNQKNASLKNNAEINYILENFSLNTPVINNGTRKNILNKVFSKELKITKG